VNVINSLKDTAIFYLCNSLCNVFFKIINYFLLAKIFFSKRFVGIGICVTFVTRNSTSNEKYQFSQRFSRSNTPKIRR
jgi:hypothetical protein